MPTNIKIKTHVVKQLPAERPLEKGAVYKVEQPNGDLLTYTIDSSGNPVLERGITNEQNTRLERLSSEQISKVESITTGDITKLKEDYTKAEIDQQFNDVRNFANSSRINLNGSTVLPVPPRRPDNTVIEDAWVRLAQNVTYTQAGGSPLTGIDGHETVAEWNNEDGEWVLVDMGELPQVTGTDILNPTGESIPKEKAVADYVAPFNSVIISSVNLYNPETTLSGGYRLSDGTVAESNNLIRTPILPIHSGQTSVSVTEAGGIAGAQARIVFVNDLGLPISQTQESINVPFPPGSTGFGVTIANEANVGLDPTNNPYINTLMINYGEPLPYEPYGNAVVNADKLNKIPSLVQTELTDLDTRVQFLENMYTYEYEFPVGESIQGLNFVLNNTGDFVEFTGRASTPVVVNILRILGDNISNRNSFGFYGSMVRLRENITSGAWVEFTNVPTFEEYHKYKLQVNGSNWDLYVDDVLVDTRPKSAEFVIANIGNGYAQTLPFWLMNDVVIRVGGVETIFKNFDLLNPNIIKTEINPTPEPVDSYADIYVSLNKTGYSGRDLLTVYVKRESTNNYVGIHIGHQLTPSTDGDLYRILYAYEYSFNGNAMVQIGSNWTISSGESEFTTQIQGKSGHFGGAHGRELHSLIKIFIDGVEKSMDSSFALIPASSFFYVQKSNIINDDVNLTPLMEHYKRTDFNKGRYKTFNRVVGLVNPSITMQYIYTGIVCVGRSNALKVTDDYFNSSLLGQIDGSVLNSTGKSTLNFEGNTLGMQISSKSILPTEPNEVNTKLWVQDRVTIGDSKYYKVNNGSSTIPLALNETWEVECEVVFK